jgi:DNA (cytosine-5)-methyltransferase 1
MQKIRVFDLFAGVGGFRLAIDKLNLKKHEFDHVGHCEIEPKANEFYRKFHKLNDKSWYIDDVKNICSHKNQNGITAPSFDLLLAGFPCQSFSNVGHRRGLIDPRGQLFYEILYLLEYYKPRFFVLENVQKLATIKRGGLLNEMTAALEQTDIGYHLHTWDLLASHYGLPQKRKRLFFCGIRSDAGEKQDVSPPTPIALKDTQYPTAWHLLEKGPVSEAHLIPKKTRKTVLYKNINWAGNVNIDNSIARPITATMAKWHRANQDNYYSETYINGESPNKRPNIDLETERIRRITPLEGFRLQGFPDRAADVASELQLSFSAQYKMIGNAVPVNLAHAVLNTFLEAYLCQ